MKLEYSGGDGRSFGLNIYKTIFGIKHLYFGLVSERRYAALLITLCIVAILYMYVKVQIVQWC